MEHLMTSEELAEILHVDPVTIRRLVNKGDLSAYRIGADFRFAPSDLKDYLQRQRITAHAQRPPESGNHALEQFFQGWRARGQGLQGPLADGQHFDMFSEQVRTVLLHAQEEAQLLRHNYIGTEHLLLGLVREEEGVASQVLQSAGMTTEKVREAVELIVSPGKRVEASNPGLTPRAKKVIELACNEAHRLSQPLVNTEHLLLGLLREGEGIAFRVLRNLGLDLNEARQQILRILQEQSQVRQSTVNATEVLGEQMVVAQETSTCASCGTVCPEHFRYCFNCGQPLVQKEHGEQGHQ